MKIKHYEGQKGNNSHQTEQILGYFDPKKLIFINGENNEQLLFKKSNYGRYSKDQWDDFKDYVSKGQEYPILIIVENKVGVGAVAKIAEGNHTIRACLQLGVKVYAEIRIYGHAHHKKLLDSIGVDIPEFDAKSAIVDYFN